VIIENEVTTAPYTSWLIGGKAQYFVLPKSLQEIKEALQFANEQKLPVTVLSGGSNVLISDEGIAGLTICLKDFKSYEVSADEKNLRIRCDSGVGKSELLKVFLKYRLAPALFLAGIPGDVGGGVVMNAGVAESFSPREFVELTEWVEGLDLNTQELKRFKKEDLKWAYRHCEGLQNILITAVGLKWQNEPQDDVLPKVRDANRTRLSKQPLDKPSCGSVFKNPVGYKAAQLIDSAGMKGFQIGEAQVSLKHANFIVNLGEATASDTWEVMLKVIEKVQEVHEVTLQTEVRRLGRWRDLPGQ
jgi:UDP-N-acetylmuramate dehydrogenase